LATEGNCGARTKTQKGSTDEVPGAHCTQSRGAVDDAAFIITVAGEPAGAGTLTGSVQTQGQSLAGAMVTAIDSLGKLRDTVYVEAQEHFGPRVAISGQMTVRARAPYYKDGNQEISVAADGQRSLSFRLQR